jgi:hypothetical protein
MKKLKVDIDDIALAMQFSDEIEESTQFLDTETGEVVNIFRSVMDDIEEGNAEAIGDYPEWMKEMADDAEAMLNDEKGRFVEIPKISSHEAYEFMENFLWGIKDEKIKDRLLRAIQGRGAFRRFKDTISEWPDLEKRWYEYEEEAIRKEVLDWLESIGIEPEG